MNISFCIITFSAASSFYKSACDLIERALSGVQSSHDTYVLVHRVSPLFMGFSHDICAVHHCPHSSWGSVCPLYKCCPPHVSCPHWIYSGTTCCSMKHSSASSNCPHFSFLISFSCVPISGTLNLSVAF